MVGNNCAVPKEGNSGRSRGEADAGFLHRGEDAPPSILVFFREDIIEDVLQCLPLKESCAVGAESVVDLYEGLREVVAAEAVGQLEQHGGIGGDGEGNVVSDGDGGHDKPLSAPFSRETFLFYYICC